MSIQAQYEAEVRRQDAQHTARIAALEAQRAGLIPVVPGASAMRPIVACPYQRATLGELDAQLARLAELHAEAHRRLDRARDAAIRTSQRQRDAEVTASRARLRTQANAAAAEEGRPTHDDIRLSW